MTQYSIGIKNLHTTEKYVFHTKNVYKKMKYFHLLERRFVELNEEFDTALFDRGMF